VIAAMYELYRDREKRPEPFTADDFLASGQREQEEEDDDDKPDPEALEEFKRRMKKSLGIV
jgi:hypothetical protein